MNVSGLTPLARLLWIRSSPTAAAAFRPSSRSPRLEQVALRVRRVRPDAGEAVGLQLEPHRELVRARPGPPAARRSTSSIDAEQVLDVVADLVRDHVGLREVAGRAEALCSSRHEREVDVDLAGRAGQ